MIFTMSQRFAQSPEGRWFAFQTFLTLLASSPEDLVRRIQHMSWRESTLPPSLGFVCMAIATALHFDSLSTVLAWGTGASAGLTVMSLVLQGVDSTLDLIPVRYFQRLDRALASHRLIRQTRRLRMPSTRGGSRIACRGTRHARAPKRAGRLRTASGKKAGSGTSDPDPSQTAIRLEGDLR